MSKLVLCWAIHFFGIKHIIVTEKIRRIKWEVVKNFEPLTGRASATQFVAVGRLLRLGLFPPNRRLRE
jgi:hypothetical protein